MVRWHPIFSLFLSLVTMSFPWLAMGVILWLAALVAMEAGMIILLSVQLLGELVVFFWDLVVTLSGVCWGS